MYGCQNAHSRMGLDSNMQARLGEIIDLHIRGTPSLLSGYRKEQRRWAIQYPEDFVYGYVVGQINVRFNEFFYESKKRDMKDDESDDFYRIIENNLSKIKDALI